MRLVWWDRPGGNPPVLLLHGIGNYARYWDLVADAVGGRMRLIASDARGHGQSAAPGDPAMYASREFVADAIAILDAAGVDGALIVGHSMGGGHAARIAISHPQRARGLVLVDWSPAPLTAGAHRARRLSLERPPSFADDAAALAYLRETSPGYTDAVYDNRLAHAFVRGAEGLTWRSSPRALRAILSGTSDDAVPDLADIACPVLVVRGTRSNVLSAETARGMTERIADARSLELDAGHNVALERPAELADAISELAGRLQRSG